METTNEFRKAFRDEHQRTGVVIPYEKWLEKQLQESEEKRRVIAALTIKINKRRARWKTVAKKYYN